MSDRPWGSSHAGAHASPRMPASAAGPRPEISIVIKTLNEEARIAAAIRSALSALEGFHGEVIVADSRSTDSTVAIASAFPVTVVQLLHAAERSCGIGGQLGYQHARGDLIYILDGDMELTPGFLPQAVAYLKEHPDVAGVAGTVEELGAGNYEFEARIADSRAWSVAGRSEWLDMGGLYRRTALEETGYFTNRNLHACEELELGLRLTEAGWSLVRLPALAVRHHGRTESSWALMRQRLRSRYSDGPGELLRAALGTPHFQRAVRSQYKLVSVAGFWAATGLGAALFPWSPAPLLLAVGLFSALFLAMLYRKRSLSQALMGMINWQVRTAGFVRGLLSPQRDPRPRIESLVVTRAHAAATAAAGAGSVPAVAHHRGGAPVRPSPLWVTSGE